MSEKFQANLDVTPQTPQLKYKNLHLQYFYLHQNTLNENFQYMLIIRWDSNIISIEI